MRTLLMISAALTALCGSAAAAGPKPCPPGLADKGCTPPGQAKKYAVGAPLPSGYPYVRDRRAYRLPPPPEGHRYAKVDRDIVLVAEASRKVVEVVAIIDALGD
ncbi:RcnB family protein [Parvularcula dongshanensis]|uniref:Excinuclease ABC subunit A n=1 Tax=Parvularcula dongshanensis TaxID=1173995 RepID=A0A840I0H9_9PROT|nr:RcnB family protein [Parvularcula dongshanensis]MBB4658217.1 hypothetical protein [Parvularcula dongshanensis]